MSLTHSTAPAWFLTGDHRHLPPVRRPGPHLRRALDAQAAGAPLPALAAAAATSYERAAASFVAADERTAAELAKLLDPEQQTSVRRFHPAIVERLGLADRQWTEQGVVAAAISERSSHVRSFNAFVDTADRRARTGFVRAALLRAACWAAPVAATAAATAAFL